MTGETFGSSCVLKQTDETTSKTDVLLSDLDVLSFKVVQVLADESGLLYLESDWRGGFRRADGQRAEQTSAEARTERSTWSAFSVFCSQLQAIARPSYRIQSRPSQTRKVEVRGAVCKGRTPAERERKEGCPNSLFDSMSSLSLFHPPASPATSSNSFLTVSRRSPRRACCCGPSALPAEWAADVDEGGAKTEGADGIVGSEAGGCK